MSTLKTYNVQINSSDGEMISANTNNTTFFHEHLECHSITALTVSITVVNSEGLHSDPVMKTIVIQGKCSRFIDHHAVTAIIIVERL